MSVGRGVMKWAMPVIAVVFLHPAMAANASGELEKFVVCNDSRLYAQPERIVVAKNITSAFQTLAAQIPAVTDEEERWLKAEIDETLVANGGTPTIRARKAEKSPAYAKRHAKIMTDHLVAVAKNLSEGHAAVSEEMKAWISLQNVMFDYRYSDYLTVLLDAQILTSADVPMIVAKEQFKENNKVATRCLIYSIVNELPP